MTVIKGENVVIKENVTIGENVVIGNNVIIYDGTIIGNNVMIQDNVVIGKQPSRAKNSILPEVKKLPPAIIGAGCTIGTSAIIYANATLEEDVFVADLATIRERVSIGEKTIVGRGVAVENDCKVGKKCKLETNSYITAYSELGDFVFIAPYVVTTNDNYMARSKERYDKFKGVTIKDGGRVGANSTILPGKVIHEDGAVAAGSVVTKDVEKETIVVGSPARKLRDVPENQLLRNQ
ncbi:acetyltransferase-like isoleucine patch superfamily enzyme [Bacillus mesophilus]|uniref:N-acetyltransferase n=1 Tax=Bacillus mesophilus TaxID=1808955 RepID=A0A6M0QB83_9BACI|nr:N-acetyltransferase [Bacillus mesophilus]MBM7661609.1 acetyltransferase-like isoleucine patch superfamily enzyme [Bacillus mesophilus]NEY72278.1 N-acetyltransferase [Bacillus mesophilus]